MWFFFCVIGRQSKKSESNVSLKSEKSPFETPQPAPKNSQVEITSSGRRRIRPMKYKDYDSAGRGKNTINEPSTSAQSIQEIETPPAPPVKEYRRKRGDRELIESTPIFNLSDSKRTRGQLSSGLDTENENRAAKRKISLHDDEIDFSTSSKKQRTARDTSGSTTPTRSTRGRSLAPTESSETGIKTEKGHKRRRATAQQVIDETVDTSMATESVQIKEEPSGFQLEVSETKGRRGHRTALLQTNIKSEEQTEPPRRGRRPTNPPTLINIIESDTQSEAAENTKKVSSRSLRMSNRVDPNTHSTGRRSSRNLSLQDQTIDSPSMTGASTEPSGDELQKISDRRGGRRGKRNKNLNIEKIPVESPPVVENQSEDDNDSMLDEDSTLSQPRKSKIVLADIFTKSHNDKRAGKRKRSSPIVGKSGARVSSRIAAAALAASTNSQGGGSSDDQLPSSSKKQMTLPEMMQMQQAKTSATALLSTESKVEETILIDDETSKELPDSSQTITTNVSESFTTPVKDTPKPIATTPKLRGKRTGNQNEGKPIDEYSAEADDEMEDDIKLCTKKKLMVALKDINSDRKLLENTTIRTNALIFGNIQDSTSSSSSSMQSTTKVTPIEPEPTPSLPKQHEPNVERHESHSTTDISSNDSKSARETIRETTEKSISDRHSAAVAKKTKKQKIMESDVNIEPPVIEISLDTKTSEQKIPVHHRSERKTTIDNDNEANETSFPSLVTTISEVEPEKSEKLEKQKSPVEESVDDTKPVEMDIEESFVKCDDTANKATPQLSEFDKQKMSQTNLAHPKLETQISDSQQPSNKAEEHSPSESNQSEAVVSENKTITKQDENASTSVAESIQSPFPNSSPIKSTDSWANNRSHKDSTKFDKSPTKSTESIDNNALPTVKSPPPSTVFSHTKISPEKVEKYATAESRPNVIVDAPSEQQEQKHSTSLKNETENFDRNERKSKEFKHISPNKIQSDSLAVDNKMSNENIVEPNSELLKSPSEINVESEKSQHTKEKLKISDSDTETEANAKKSSSAKNSPEKAVTSLINEPPEKLHNVPPESTPISDKSKDCKNSVIKSVIEPNSNVSSVDRAPFTTTSNEISKNDETKTTTQDFCQRTDPNKNPQSAPKTETKVELPRDQHKTEHNQNTQLQHQYQSQTSVEKSHRLHEMHPKPSAKEAIIQPKEEMYRGETPTQHHIKSESQKSHQAHSMQLAQQQMQQQMQQQLQQQSAGMYKSIFMTSINITRKM